eukprot:TRINITY_DN283_c0_g1_i1.p1 TRINITY_DN283_c0_g1~~TRINITY_DN283_c0_g1_i1.p1  ORF type:complete len:135 (+),score=29.83 TRINITY_DN283_c0_g1_i1:41-445(+)
MTDTNSKEEGKGYFETSKDWMIEHPYIVGGAVVGGVVLPFSLPILLYSLGFTAAGVAYGSLAAAAQSAIYAGATGGFISALQSAGAAGLALTTYAGASVGGAAGGAAAGNWLSRTSWRRRKEENKSIWNLSKGK